jgi:hypothetical protein
MAAQQWRRRDGRSNGREGGGAEVVMAAQRPQWQRSNGDGGTATAMAVQQQLRGRSNGLGGTATALAVQQRQLQ